MEITFDDGSDEYNDELVEEGEISNLIDYVREDDREGNNKEGEENKEEFKGGDNESGDLKSRCESDDSN